VRRRLAMIESCERSVATHDQQHHISDGKHRHAAFHITLSKSRLRRTGLYSRVMTQDTKCTCMCAVSPTHLLMHVSCRCTKKVGGPRRSSAVRLFFFYVDVTSGGLIMFGCVKFSHRNHGVTVVINDHIDDEHMGVIMCIPPTHMMPPFSVAWYRNKQDVTAALTLEPSQLCARKVPPGNYSISITDSRRKCVDVCVDVRGVHLPIISKYTGTPATTGTSRNGLINAHIVNAPVKCKYLWTTGIVTDEASLRAVPVGVYTVMPINEDGTPLPCIHKAAPYRVTVDPDFAVSTVENLRNDRVDANGSQLVRSARNS